MMELTFLGTTSGIPTTERGHSAIALQVSGEILLFDCGENTQRQMMEAKLSMMKINNIFITHWHSDHTVGLLGLMETMSLLGREKPLTIYGPAGTKKAVKSLLNIGYKKKLLYELNVKEVKEGAVMEEKEFSISCIPANHSLPALSYKFSEIDKPGKFNLKAAKKLGLKEQQYGILQKGNPVKVGKKTIKPEDVLGPTKKGTSIVYSGDTIPTERMVEFAKEVDLLIHEGTFTKEFEDNAQETMHSVAEEAAKIAKEAKVKKLILTHISARYKTSAPILKEAKKVFKNSYVAEDLTKVRVKH